MYVVRHFYPDSFDPFNDKYVSSRKQHFNVAERRKAHKKKTNSKNAHTNTLYKSNRKRYGLKIDGVGPHVRGHRAFRRVQTDGASEVSEKYCCWRWLRFAFLLAQLALSAASEREMCLDVLYECSRKMTTAATAADRRALMAHQYIAFTTKLNEVKNVVLIEIELRLIAISHRSQAHEETKTKQK